VSDPRVARLHALQDVTCSATPSTTLCLFHPSRDPPPYNTCCDPEVVAPLDALDSHCWPADDYVPEPRDPKMASQSTGIQQLLVAEKRAAEKVEAARKRKQKRLKQAKEEAQSEVDAYRQEREGIYKQHEDQHMGSRGDLEAKIDVQTDVKLKEVDVAYESHKEVVLKNLLDLVMDVEPQLHKNQNNQSTR